MIADVIEPARSAQSKTDKSPGLQDAPDPPAGDALEVALHYLKWYEAEYSRARLATKQRAKGITVSTAICTASIAVIGAVIPVTGWTWLGVVSVAVAGASTVIERWDGLLRYRTLWLQRSGILENLHRLRRQAELQRARGMDRDELADKIMLQLDQILSADVASWTELRLPKGAVGGSSNEQESA